MTKDIEGDGPTGALVIPIYVSLRNILVEKKNSSTRDEPLYPMWKKMIEKVNKYLDEAVDCDSLIMATILHPAFRLEYISQNFPGRRLEVEKMITDMFNARKLTIKSKDNQAPTEPSTSRSAHQSLKEQMQMNMFHKATTKAEIDELSVYLKGMDTFEAEVFDSHTSLEWWKVCFFLF